jgi:hypothetical protein
MKDSGIEWIGQVPEHWEAKNFFALVTERTERMYLLETIIRSSAETGSRSLKLEI